eukprot:scaffold96506_cov42-Prasinocladus_malaysianus.AAC.1
MRNARLKALRDQYQDSSRFVLGNGKVLRVALGKTASDEYQQNLHEVSDRMAGNSGLFFTNLPDAEVCHTWQYLRLGIACIHILVPT